MDKPAAIMKSQGKEVPEKIFYLFLGGSRSDGPLAETLEEEWLQYEGIQGCIYDPPWTTAIFALLNDDMAICIGGLENKDAASKVLNDFEKIERISHPVVVNRTQPIRKLSRVPERYSESSGDETAGFALNPETMFDSIVRDGFYGELQHEKVDIPPTPEGKAGELISAIATTNNSFSEESELATLADESPEEIRSVLPHLLNLLHADSFSPYSVDDGNRSATIQPVFNEIAETYPEDLLNHQEELVQFLRWEQSTTTPEVVTQAIEALIMSNPEKADQFHDDVEKLFFSGVSHPKRRAVRIATTMIKADRRDVITALHGDSDRFVDDVIEELFETDSMWLQRACCLFLHYIDLDDASLDLLAPNAGKIVEIARTGGDFRGEKIPPLETSTSPPEYGENDSPSAELIYRLHRAAILVVRKLAEERPEFLVESLDALFDDATSGYEQQKNIREKLKIVRREAHDVLLTLAKEEPIGLTANLAKYDHQIERMANQNNPDVVLKSIRLLRVAATPHAVNTLQRIHHDNTHRYWQQATEALADIAPDAIDHTIEPKNLQQEWEYFIKKLAKENKRLPSKSEARGHPDSPGEYPYRVFGSWNDVLQSLDFENNRLNSNAPLRSALIKDLQEVASKVDGIPTTGDIKSYSQFTYYDYKKGFGGIGNARSVAGVNK